MVVCSWFAIIWEFVRCTVLFKKCLKRKKKSKPGKMPYNLLILHFTQLYMVYVRCFVYVICTAHMFMWFMFQLCKRGRLFCQGGTYVTDLTSNLELIEFYMRLSAFAL